ncbi:glutathione S-transferase family protein [Elioraea sp.]|uniref:glutathione S-transferase family protein n=1 Tax=Elioraea sp. TaxID=2185103 RepID=UPI003F719094
MADGTLWIGTRMTSSWSLRGWLAVRLAGLDVAEVVIGLDQPDTAARIRAVSPGGTVPVLSHKGALVWESIAIAEYCAEMAPGLWPSEPRGRAHARAIAAEMHAGFRGLRSAMWMNIDPAFCTKAAGSRRTAEALADIARIEALWRDTRARFGDGGPYLFGAAFTLADAMYAPVTTRFTTWRPDLAADSWAYVEAVQAHPLMRRWFAEAATEPDAWKTPKYFMVPA